MILAKSHLYSLIYIFPDQTLNAIMCAVCYEAKCNNNVHLLFMDHSNVSLVFWWIQGSVKMSSVDHIQSAIMCCPWHVFIGKYMSSLSSGVAWSHLVVVQKKSTTKLQNSMLYELIPKRYKETEIKNLTLRMNNELAHWKENNS